ncbi:hypothetical protein EPN44_10795 [bacterium]|nr:MAG: hypothetical protein EPN44_10795 [bacterium]
MASRSTSSPAKLRHPARPVLSSSDPRKKLDENLRDALRALPAYFKTDTFIDGIEAVDLFALNSSLGGTIENQVVETLNTIRKVWDPDDEWLEYRFERRSQSFPDVRLVSRSGGIPTTKVGIELKGWYLLSKEGVPSFRYTATPSACAENDLLVIVPWQLKNVLSGHPVVHAPYIESARYAAEARNHWWSFVREAKTDARINVASGASPYPPSKAGINDEPKSDKGGNFGRVARLGLPDLDSYIRSTVQERVCGIEAANWIQFFKAFTDARDSQDIWDRVEALFKQKGQVRESEAEHATELLRELTALLTNGNQKAVP